MPNKFLFSAFLILVAGSAQAELRRQPQPGAYRPVFPLPSVGRGCGLRSCPPYGVVIRGLVYASHVPATAGQAPSRTSVRPVAAPTFVPRAPLPSRYQIHSFLEHAKGQPFANACAFNFVEKKALASNPRLCRYKGVTAAHCLPTEPGTQRLSAKFTDAAIFSESRKMVGYGGPADLRILFSPRYRSGRGKEAPLDDFAFLAYTGLCTFVPDRDIAKLAPSRPPCGLSARQPLRGRSDGKATPLNLQLAGQQTVDNCIVLPAPGEAGRFAKGDSGGGLFDSAGRLVGVLSMMHGRVGNPQPVSFSYSARFVDFVLGALIRTDTIGKTAAR